MITVFERITDGAYDATMMTAMHVRRVARVLTTTAAQLGREVRGLAEDVRDVAVAGFRSAPDDIDLPRDVGPVRLRRVANSKAADQ